MAIGGWNEDTLREFVRRELRDSDLRALISQLQGLAASTGDLKPSAAATPPPGWLVCDGSAVSRSTFATLFGAIGTAYGAGDGSTTFNLPDLRGRVPVGAGTGAGLTARTLGAAGGEENHTLSAAEMPSHNHGGATGSMNRNNPHMHSPNVGGVAIA